MTPLSLTLKPVDLEALAGFAGTLGVIIDDPAKLAPAGARLDRLMRGGLRRFLASEAFGALKPGEAKELAYPSGLAAQGLIICALPRKSDALAARKAGGAMASGFGKTEGLILAGNHPHAGEIGLGAVLRSYEFADHKTAEPKPQGALSMMVADPARAEAAVAEIGPLAEGVFFTRDLVNEPANVLTTTEFARRLSDLRQLGLTVEVLDEAELAKLGMGALLGVGQGSQSPSHVVVMQWNGGEKGAAPFALVGKGVVFDSGGISIKPAGGMEEMTMDMGGAGVVAGVMKTLALRGAKANVVGLVGLVENMPDGRAQRPGDVVRSMKGDTIEVINTDAEGRLVLADVLWYAQERFKPSGIINLATLTGAIIVALGTENAGVFSNDDPLCAAFLAAAAAEGEGAWRMPMGAAYDAKLKSRIADMMNVGGREGGSITAAQFIKRFIKDGQPWIHLDIAGVTLAKSATDLAPKGATGWGVLALDRLIRQQFEPK
jgi:leucyl aminopeptidase